MTNMCDEQSEGGNWDRSCDLHPSTGCDDWTGCSYPPPPPLAPAPPGGYAPPPGPPTEEDVVPMIIGYAVVAVVLVLMLVCCCVWRQYYSLDQGTAARGRFHRSFCCCVELCRNSNWRDDEEKHGERGDGSMLSKDEFQARDERLVEIMQRNADIAASVMPSLALDTRKS